MFFFTYNGLYFASIFNVALYAFGDNKHHNTQLLTVSYYVPVLNKSVYLKYSVRKNVNHFPT